MVRLRVLLFLLICQTSWFALSQSSRLQKGEKIPAFSKADVYGTPVSPQSLLGKKVLLSFTRSAGCPICNVYVHELLVNADSFRQQGIEIWIVSQSSDAEIRGYIEDENLPFHFISDTEDGLYKLFSIEKSRAKIKKGVFKGGIKKMLKGKKLYNQPLHYEGNKDIIGADFLIDANGRILTAFYGDYLGHRLSITDILRYFR